jgi:hypothetical protein
MKNCIPLLAFFAVACCQTPPQTNPKISAALCRHWVHSFEEDTPGLRIFRPVEFPFPPARGRESIEFLPHGQCLHHPIGPTDLPLSLPGTWKMIARDKCRMSVKGYDPTDFKILELNNEKLVVKN